MYKTMHLLTMFLENKIGLFYPSHVATVKRQESDKFVFVVNA